MKKLRLTLSFIFLIIMLNGCVNYPVMETDVIGAGVPLFEGKAKEILLDRKASSIQVEATITSENGETITERGFVYGISPSPSLEKGDKIVVDTETGIGTYTLTIENLDNNTNYYIQPYAKNKMGTGYGPPNDDLIVHTNEGVASVETLPPDTAFVRATTAPVGGKLTDAGESEIIKLGIYVFEKADIAKIDTIVYPVSVAVGDTFVCQLTGLTPDTWYYFEAFVENRYGTTRGGRDSLLTWDGKPTIDTTEIIDRGFTYVTLSSSVTDGGDETVLIAERGFCWSNNALPLPDITNNILLCDDGDGDFTGKIEGLESNKTYYARAFAKSNAGIIVYGELTALWTYSDIPTVRTEEVIEMTIQSGNADVRGVIENEGMSAVYESGICWSTTEHIPTVSDSKLPLIAGTNGLFSGRLTRLRGGIIYYVRAYAINNQGTGYGDVVQFTTPPIFTDLMQFSGATRVINSMAYFAVDGFLYLLGGDLQSRFTDELWRYSIEDNKWEEFLPFEAGPIRWQSAATYGKGAYIYGGYNGKGDEKPGIYYYDASFNHWRYYEGPDSTIVNRALGYSYSNSVFYIGGFSADTVREDVWRYTPSTPAWQKRTDFPVKQYGGVAVVMNDIVYAGMGRDASNVCNGSLWTTSDEAITWNLKTTYPVTGYVFGGVVCNRRLYIIDESYYMIEYNPETNEWTRKSKFPRNTVHCILTDSNKIFIGLGQNIITMYDPSWDN